MSWTEKVDNPDRDDEPDSLFDFAFTGAPQAIVSGSGWHTFRVRLTDFEPAKEQYRWDLDVVDAKNRSRHVIGARVEYRGAQGHWQAVTWTGLHDAPDFLRPRLHPIQPYTPPPGSIAEDRDGLPVITLTLRVNVGAEAGTEVALLEMSAGKVEMASEWMPTCLDIARSSDPHTRPQSVSQPAAKTTRGPLRGWGLPLAALLTGVVTVAGVLRARKRRHPASQLHT
ncbi:hypothetical protein ACH492_36850 [Streptomyces sp. NPDC019443]|uniref:hypothetical protein n=1 Tax=Streptomyces sp. NPDC019443 TaxID=3365061 RepID=UPI0037AE15E7